MGRTSILVLAFSALLLLRCDGSSAGQVQEGDYLADLIARMEAAEKEAHYSFRPFVSSYRLFTEALKVGGEPEPQRVALVTAFWESFENRTTAGAEKAGWRYVREETASRRRCTVFWQAFAGVMAHLANDMPFALVAAFPTAPELEAVRELYDAVGDALHANIDKVQANLAVNFDPAIALLSHLAPFNLDVWFSNKQIQHARDGAYDLAMRYVTGDVQTRDELEVLAAAHFYASMTQINLAELVTSRLPGMRNYCSPRAEERYY